MAKVKFKEKFKNLRVGDIVEFTLKFSNVNNRPKSVYKGEGVVVEIHPYYMYIVEPNIHKRHIPLLNKDTDVTIISKYPNVELASLFNEMAQRVYNCEEMYYKNLKEQKEVK